MKNPFYTRCRVEKAKCGLMVLAAAIPSAAKIYQDEDPDEPSYYVYIIEILYIHIYILCLYIHTSILSDFPRFCWWLPPFLLVFLFPGVCRLPYLLFGEYPHYTFVIPR